MEQRAKTAGVKRGKEGECLQIRTPYTGVAKSVQAE